MKKYLRKFLKQHPRISADFHEWNEDEFQLFCEYLIYKYSYGRL